MHKQTDYLIIGSGIAGLATAYYLKDQGKVTVLTKGAARNANTYWAQGGVAAVMDKNDNFENHIKDTLEVGQGLCDPAAVRQVVFGAPKAVRSLESLGLKVQPQPLLEAGHSHARVWRSSDFTGRDILNVLLKAVQKEKSIEIIEKTEAVELIEVKGKCVGVFTRQANSDKADLEILEAKYTILATGGLGQLFGHTSNTIGSGGDGLALAVNAGLELQDIEFVQFHPTGLAVQKEGRHFLISETLRGEGAKIVNNRGEAFLSRFHPKAELAPRDLVSRAVFIEEMTGPIYLDATHLPANKLKTTFPNIYQTLKGYDIDMTTQKIPVTPVAHYSCGGVPVDQKGATALPGLYAVGEVARTGLHGANRLASNSLLESLVYAKIVAESLEKTKTMDVDSSVDMSKVEIPSVPIEDIDQIKAYAGRIGKIMWENVGILRTEASLEKAKQEIVSIPARDYRIQHRQLVAYKIILACQARPQSLGTHYMTSDIV